MSSSSSSAEEEEEIVIEDSLQSIPPSASEVASTSTSVSPSQSTLSPPPSTSSTSASSKAKAFVPHTHSSGCFEVISSNNGNFRYKCLCKTTKNAECDWEGKHQSAKKHLESAHTDSDLARFTGTKATTKPLSQLGFTSKSQAQIDAERHEAKSMEVVQGTLPNLRWRLALFIVLTRAALQTVEKKVLRLLILTAINFGARAGREFLPSTKEIFPNR
jgi:hypothetical protein